MGVICSSIIVEAHRNRPSQILSGLALFDHYVCCDEIPAFIIIQLCLVCHKNAKNAFRTVFIGGKRNASCANFSTYASRTF